MTRTGGALAALLLVCAACAAPPTAVPDFASVRQRTLPSDRYLLDRQGRVLDVQRVDFSRRRLAWTELRDVSPALLTAIVAAEDQRFFTHGGVDGLALLRAVTHRLLGRNGGGASTVSMQVAALIGTTSVPAGRRGLATKWQQMRAAWALERSWSKQQILETYINLVTYRGEVEGIASAAEVLFGRRPHALSLAQSIVLAASVRAPNASTPQLLTRAQHLAHRLEVDDVGEISQATERLGRRSLTAPPRPALAPHVAAHLLGPNHRDDVQTTLDADLQRHAIEALQRQLLALADRGVRDGAVLAVDNQSGEVIAYVGSSGGLSSARHVDGVRALRQAGSTLKPFVYAVALESRRWTAASILDDTPLDLSLGGASYRPANYDRRFRGGVSLRLALASSLNVPAVRTLAQLDADEFVQRLRRFGLNSLTQAADVYGPGLALGGAEVSLWELVGAYRALANGGRTTTLRWADSSAPDAGEQVLSPAAAFIVADILADREARSLAFGLHSPLETPFLASVKTGTSSDMRDNWCIGFTSRHTVGVWVGNFSGAPMGDVSGVSGAAPVWNEVIRALEQSAAGQPPTIPPGLVPVTTESGRAEWYLAGTEPVSGNVVAADAVAQVIEPVDGAALAIDPGMPTTAQRVPFVARGSGPGWSWKLGGAWLAAADRVFLWPPAPGQYQLELVDADGVAQDTVHFRVRAAGERRRE